MKKLFYFKPKTFSTKLITKAIELGVDGILVDKEKIEQVKKLGIIKIISDSNKADLKLGKDIKEIMICSKEDEEKIAKIKGKIPVIIKNKDWTIIPLENLISKTSNLIQTVYNSNQAKTALSTLEKGADGILLNTDDIDELVKTSEIIKTFNLIKIELKKFKIKEVLPLGLGDRVCIDTTTILKDSEGLLIGDKGNAFFLVFNENLPSEYADARPFRINAGAVHSYILMPDFTTKYLVELEKKDEILVVNHKGESKIVNIGRLKIEKRPLVLVKAESEGEIASIILQNAETIRLTSKKGEPISITSLKKQDEVLGYIIKENIGRHFGIKIKEDIIEK